MGNPFSDLKKQLEVQRIERDGFEEVDGPMQCQTCGEAVAVGLYSETAEILTWKCSQGHVSKLKGKF